MSCSLVPASFCTNRATPHHDTVAREGQLLPNFAPVPRLFERQMLSAATAFAQLLSDGR
jgi:hypothetical protein